MKIERLIKIFRISNFQSCIAGCRRQSIEYSIFMKFRLCTFTECVRIYLNEKLAEKKSEVHICILKTMQFSSIFGEAFFLMENFKTVSACSEIYTIYKNTTVMFSGVQIGQKRTFCPNKYAPAYFYIHSKIEKSAKMLKPAIFKVVL